MSQNSKIIIWIVAILVVIGGLIFYFARPATYDNGGPAAVACTMEAKQCPDGSYVGRTGPNCEFAACPTTGTSTSSLLTPAQAYAQTTTVTQTPAPADLYK